MSANKPSILLIGCGKMGSAMLKGWQRDNSTNKVYILDPSTPPQDLLIANTCHIGDISALDTNIDLVFFATKPQIMDNVCANLENNAFLQRAVFLSIAAGKTIEYFQNFFPNAPIIRTMPNTPAAIGKGVIVACANDIINAEQKNTATALLKAGGTVEWITDESLMDAVTAVSGSGPAYIFLLIELLSKAGGQIGLKKELAESLARQTVIGSAALAENSQEAASTLRENVTSPGGTTEAALVSLMDGRLEKLLIEALEKAKNRSKELS